MTLPGSPHLARHDNELRLDGVALDELAARFGTPLFVYSQRAMLDALAAYLRPLKGRRHLLCYAMKANSTLAVLQTFARAGCGFDIVSGGELERALAAGGRADRIVFSGVGKTRSEMAQALRAKVRCFNVESVGELELLSAVASAEGCVAAVSLRINPDVDAGTHPYISTGLRENKFGIAHEDARAAYRAAASLPGLRVAGIDCHIGSQITQTEPYLAALDRLLDLVQVVESDGIPLSHIDVGGGLGITYTDERPPPADEFVRRMLERLDARGYGDREVLLEPGRSLVGNAGVLLTEVLYLKRSTTGTTAPSTMEPVPTTANPVGAANGDAATPSGRSFCIVDAAMNDLVRPAMYQAWMAIEPCRARGDVAAETYDVVGPICESGDWLGRGRQLAVRPGDRLAVLSAGAYAMAMASNYNSRARAAEVMIIDGQAVLVRERERIADMLSLEPLLPDR